MGFTFWDFMIVLCVCAVLICIVSCYFGVIDSKRDKVLLEKYGVSDGMTDMRDAVSMAKVFGGFLEDLAEDTRLVPGNDVSAKLLRQLHINDGENAMLINIFRLLHSFGYELVVQRKDFADIEASELVKMDDFLASRNQSYLVDAKIYDMFHLCKRERYMTKNRYGEDAPYHPVGLVI